jgi:hypothetical protein
MEALFLSITRGNLAEVKILLASVVAALAIYQVLLMAVGYGKIRLPFLKPKPASRAHRAIGDCILVLALFTALACISYFEVEDDNLLHAVFGTALLLVLALKVAVVRRWVGRDAMLPYLGISLLLLFAATWASSAAPRLFGSGASG